MMTDDDAGRCASGKMSAARRWWNDVCPLYACVCFVSVLACVLVHGVAGSPDATAALFGLLAFAVAMNIVGWTRHLRQCGCGTCSRRTTATTSPWLRRGPPAKTLEAASGKTNASLLAAAAVGKPPRSGVASTAASPPQMQTCGGGDALLGRVLETIDAEHADPERYPRAAVLQKAEAASARWPAQADVLWRVSRAFHQLGEELAGSDPAARARLVERSLQVAAAALRCPGGERNPDAHLAYGIALMNAASLKGDAATLRTSAAVKQHWQQAATLSNPPDPVALNLLGRYCFTFAKLSWLSRKFASVAFACAPPKSTYQESLRYFLQSEASRPKWYINTQLHIGKCYLHLKNKDEARTWFKRALALPQANAEDREDHRRVAALLAKLDGSSGAGTR